MTMATVSIAEAKDRLPALVSAAQAGETIVITRHGKPVAELRPPSGPKTYDPASIDWIERQLAGISVPETDSLKLLREMRDEE
jgi:prevent-host-death family protein